MNFNYQVSNTAHLLLTGPDAVRYLNGQVSNNVDRDLANLVLPACLCTLKGKVEALIWITKGPDPESLLIECQADQAEAVHARIDRYLIADDCELTLCDMPFAINFSSDKTATGKQTQRFGALGVDQIGKDTSDDGDSTTIDRIDYLTMIHGIPRFDHEITGDEFPAELGLDKWAVDFHKGCYLGQEIVSRIESVGKTKRQLKLIETSEPFSKGFEFENEKGKTLARVTRNSIPDPENKSTYLSLILAKQDWLPENANERELKLPSRI